MANPCLYSPSHTRKTSGIRPYNVQSNLYTGSRAMVDLPTNAKWNLTSAATSLKCAHQVWAFGGLVPKNKAALADPTRLSPLHSGDKQMLRLLSKP